MSAETKDPPVVKEVTKERSGFNRFLPLPLDSFPKESREYRRARFIRSATWPLMLLMFGYVIYNIIGGDWRMVALEAGSMLLLWYVGHNLSTERRLNQAGWIMLLWFTFMIILFVFRGKAETYSYVWLFGASLMAFPILGTKKGLLFSLVVYVPVAILFFLQAFQRISVYSLANLILALSMLIIIVFYYENGHEAAEKALDEKQQKLEFLATTDRLTGLRNRLYIEEFIEAQFKKAKAEKDKVFWSILLLDIDHFKTVNDSYGHQQGDIILQAVAKHLREEVKDNGVVARWGGEEFLVTLYGYNLSEAVALAEEIRHLVSSTPEGDRLKITLSAGVSTYKAEDNYDSLLKRADDGLYYAKMRGRDLVVSENELRKR